MNNMPTINNGGQPYYFPADIAKEGEEYARLSNFFKTRVGDNGKILTFKWYDQGRVMNVHGFIPFIQGMVGKHYEEPDTNEIVMAPDALYREWQGSTDNGHDGGFMDYILEDQMFPQEGIFKGHFGLKDTNGNILTSVNIVFEVLGNDLRVGETSKYYSAELDRLAREYEVKTDQMVADGTQKVDQFVADGSQKVDNFVAQTKSDINTSLQASRDNIDALSGEIRANRAEQANISQHLTDTQQQIVNYDVVTIPEFQTGMDTMSSAINQRLSQMKTNPIAVANAGALTTKYPNGADGIFITADTGHKWIYLDGAWKDCGVYQAIGIENEITDSIKDQLAEQQIQLEQNSKNISLNALKATNNTMRIQDIEGAGQLTEIELTDQYGNHITDENGNRVSGRKWLPLVDTTLKQAGLPADAKAVGDAISFHPEPYGIPTLYLWGTNITSLVDKSKTLKNEVTYSFPKFGAYGTVEKLKVHGQTSASLPKKSYKVTLDQDIEIFSNYGKMKSYVLKANYNDASQALNVVNAKLWGKLRASHVVNDTGILTESGDTLVDNNGQRIVGETDPQLSIGANCGAVDGFPVGVYINDEYWGLYSFTVPKDDVMAKMPKSGKHAIVGGVWEPQGAFKAETNFQDKMELDFCSTKDEQWAMDSINTLIRAGLQDYDSAQDFDNALTPLIDFDSVYDYYIYSLLIGNVDGIYRNYLLQTFDGKKWYFAAYDLDVTFGKTSIQAGYLSPRSTSGNNFYTHETTFENMALSNRLFYQFWKFHKDEVLNRTKELIDGIMSAPDVDATYINYSCKIPRIALVQEATAWTKTPDTSVNTTDRIGRWYHDRINWIKQNYFMSK